MPTSPSTLTTHYSLKQEMDKKAWGVCLSASLFFLYEFIQMSTFDTLSGPLMQTFQLTGAQLASMSAAFFYGNLLLLFPAGILLDHSSIKKIFCLSLFVCVLSVFLFATATTFYQAMIFHFIAGLCNAFCFLGCMLLATRWFSSKKLAFVTGVMVTLGMFGGIIAHTPFSFLVVALGWRKTMFINGLLGVIIFIVVFLFVENSPEKNVMPISPATKASWQALCQKLKLALANLQNFKSGLFISTLNAPLLVLGALWGSLYLTQGLSFTITQASTISSMIYFGTMIGSPIFGKISDKLSQRKMPMIVGSVITLLLSFILVFFHSMSFVFALVLFFALGFFSSVQILGYPLITESNPPNVTGTAVGLGSMIVMGGVAIFQQFFGWLIDFFWDHQLLNHIPIYSQNTYEKSLLLFPFILLVGFVMALMVRETHCYPFSKL